MFLGHLAFGFAAKRVALAGAGFFPGAAWIDCHRAPVA